MDRGNGNGRKCRTRMSEYFTQKKTVLTAEEEEEERGREKERVDGNEGRDQRKWKGRKIE